MKCKSNTFGFKEIFLCVVFLHQTLSGLFGKWGGTAPTRVAESVAQTPDWCRVAAAPEWILPERYSWTRFFLSRAGRLFLPLAVLEVHVPNAITCVCRSGLLVLTNPLEKAPSDPSWSGVQVACPPELPP